MKHAISIGLLLALGCGGVPDTLDPDARMIQVTIEELSDGTSIRTEKDMGIDPVWEDTATDIGSVEQALSIPVDVKYGDYSAGSNSNADCPDSWSSPNWCLVPATKKFNWVSTLGTSGDAAAGVALQSRWNAAISYYNQLYLSSQNGLNHDFRTDTEDVTGSGFNGVIHLGTLSPNVYMLTTTGTGSVFTSGGKRWRRQVKFSAAGYNVYNEIRVDAAQVGTYLSGAVAGPQSQTLKNNWARNAMLHEMGHAIGNGHNSNGTITHAGCSPECFTSAAIPYTSQEDAGRAGFVP